MTRPRAAIGSCPCPVKGCEAVAAVKRMQARTEDARAKRFGGKLFLVCPTHGAIGRDGAAAIQEHILECGSIDGAPPPAAEKAPENPPPAPKPATAPPPAAPKPAAPKPATAPAADAPKRGAGLLLS